MDETYVATTNKTIAQTFLWMFLGLISTGVIAAFVYYTGAIVEIAQGWTLILIAQIVIALLFGFLFRKLPTGIVTFLFFAYSMLSRSYFFSNICNI